MFLLRRNAGLAEGVTHRRILAIALPIVISNATVPILGAVDVAVVGQLGEAAPIGAVGIGAIILSTVYWIFGFLRMGTSGLTSQARGQNDSSEIAALLTRVLIFGLVAGALLMLLSVPMFRLAFLISPASDEVEGLASTYGTIRIYSAPAAIAIYGITGWLIALERTGSVLAIQLVMNCLNIVLDIIFVLVLDYGIAGVAWATMISEWSGLALGLYLCRDGFRNGHWRDWARVLDTVRLKRMASVNVDIMIRSVVLLVAFASFLFLSARYGDVTLAANQILLQFLYVTAYALDGFAFAAEALVGFSIGSLNRLALRRSVVLTSLWGLAVVVGLSVAFLLGGTAIIDLMSTADDVRAEAREYFVWVVALPMVGAPSWMLDGIFIGATRAREMRTAMLESCAVYGIAVAVLVPPFANHGLWLSMLIMLVARAVTLAVRYLALERLAGK